MVERDRSQRKLEQRVHEWTYRGMLYGIVLRDYPKQVVSLTKAKTVPANMREFLSWAQRHYRSDATTFTVCPGGCKDSTHTQRFERAFHQSDM